jgi:hypothetical protein
MISDTLLPRHGLGTAPIQRWSSAVLRHATAVMTMDLYGHLLDANLWAAAVDRGHLGDTCQGFSAERWRARHRNRPLTCSGAWSRLGNPTPDLRITRALRSGSQLSTSTDGTSVRPDSSQLPAGTRFVSHAVSHDRVNAFDLAAVVNFGAHISTAVIQWCRVGVARPLEDMRVHPDGPVQRRLQASASVQRAIRVLFTVGSSTESLPRSGCWWIGRASMADVAARLGRARALHRQSRWAEACDEWPVARTPRSYASKARPGTDRKRDRRDDGQGRSRGERDQGAARFRRHRWTPGSRDREW